MRRTVEDWRGIFRPCQEAYATDAGCIGKDADAEVAEETRRQANPGRLMGMP